MSYLLGRGNGATTSPSPSFIVPNDDPIRAHFLELGEADLTVTLLRTPLHPYVNVNHAKHSELLGNYEEAEKSLRIAKQHHPRRTTKDRLAYGRLLGDLGRIQLQTNNPDLLPAAIANLSGAIESMGDDAGNARLNRGICHFLLDQHDDALTDYQWIGKKFSDHDGLCAEAAAGIAEVYEAQGNFATALSWARKSLQRNSDCALAKDIKRNVESRTL